MTTVVYVAGKGRSGSTLLDRLLGEVDGWFSAGELWRLWDWGLRDGYDCGCGRPVPECPTWQEILRTAFGGEADSREMLRIRDAVLSWRNAPSLFLRPEKRKEPLACYVETQRRLYDGVARVTGARIVVDSSKWPFEPTLLGLVPGIRVLALHLVRDPRAVAHSWSRTKRYGDRDAAMARFGVVHSAASWLARNATLELVRRRTPVPWRRLRYEDLVDDPHRMLGAIVRDADEETPALPFLDGRTVRLGGHHMIGGNPSRETAGAQPLLPDDEWIGAMARHRQAVVTGLTLPLLLGYGYRVRSRAARRAERG